MKPVAQLFKFPAQLKMVVNLPVEDNRRVAIIRDDGLVSALQVNNFQARSAHRKDARTKNPALIRAAMSQRSGSPFDALRLGGPIFMCESGYPAQIPTPFACQSRQPAFPPLRPGCSTRGTAPSKDTSLIPMQPAPLPRTPAPRQPSAPCSLLHPEYILLRESQPRSSKPTPESQS